MSSIIGVVSMLAPIKSRTSKSPVRVGLRLTSVMVNWDSGKISAALNTKAAEEKSPGTVSSMPVSKLGNI